MQTKMSFSKSVIIVKKRFLTYHERWAEFGIDLYQIIRLIRCERKKCIYVIHNVLFKINITPRKLDSKDPYESQVT